ncbi:PucR family transcriptional regulator [Nonomuraea purpurea]|uniref:PucR family transcriptional regulator n=1 Tax=Nonomuraea purpurea TaxID=1849276 RepID=A0ABV8GHU4_9ACTN
MPPSLQTVVRRMGLRPLAGITGRGALNAAVRWVAVSELADPTPYLEGEELLLTTGMRMEGDLSGYVARLVARGVTGLGFGVGVSHEQTPAALVTAADEAGLPLLEVPRETPFIAIGKAVSELLAAEQYEEITRAFAAQGRLTRAALKPEGMHAVIDRLAKEIGGWAALLDEAGEVRHATHGAQDVAAELARLRRLPEPGGSVASLALSGPGEHIVVQPLGGGARPRGFFAVGAKQAFPPVVHTVINAAGSLLTLSLEQGRSQLAAVRRVRSAVLELLLAGEGERARAVLGPLGGRLPEEPLVVLAAGADALEALEGHGFAALHASSAVALVTEEVAEKAGQEVDGPVGGSLPCGYGETSLRTGLDQARRALEAARTRGDGMTWFRKLAGQGLLGLLDQSAAQAFSAYSEALLAPLTGYGSRVDLVESLRAYLDSNGHWDAAAQRLGVHRHTLRYRMKRVTELLARDLDDPGVRAELWLALEATQRHR